MSDVDSNEGQPSPARSGSQGSRSRSNSGSRSGSSRRSGSNVSRRSGSGGSQRSGSNDSRASNVSGSKPSSHSGSGRSSPKSARSRSGSPEERQSVADSGSEVEKEKGRRSGSDSDGSSVTKTKKRAKVSPKSGSDSDSPVSRRRQGKKPESGSDEDEEDGEKPNKEDLFGDDLSISSDDDDSESGKKAPRRQIDSDSDEGGDVKRYEDDVDERDDDEPEQAQKRPEKAEQRAIMPEEEEEPIPETRIDVEVPKITTNLGKELHFVKLPNFLSIDCRPFDPENYEDEIEDEDSLDEEGRARLKLKVENTIRWRQGFDAEGKAIMESNAKFVRWSDGSLSLHLGSEIFDVHKQSLQGDFNHLFIRQGTGLQGQAVFRTKLSFRPHSTESFTHQKMTRSMADRTNKTSGIKVISQVGKDPEANRFQRVKEEEERLRADMRRDSKVRRFRDKARSRGLTAGYLEGGESDEEGVSIAAIKNKYKKNKKEARPTYSSDEEDEGSDIELNRTKRLEKAKEALKDSDEESGQSNRSRSSRSRSRSRSKSKSRSPSASNSSSSRKSSESEKKQETDSD